MTVKMESYGGGCSHRCRSIVPASRVRSLSVGPGTGFNRRSPIKKTERKGRLSGRVDACVNQEVVEQAGLFPTTISRSCRSPDRAWVLTEGLQLIRKTMSRIEPRNPAYNVSAELINVGVSPCEISVNHRLERGLIPINKSLRIKGGLPRRFAPQRHLPRHRRHNCKGCSR